MTLKVFPFTNNIPIFCLYKLHAFGHTSLCFQFIGINMTSVRTSEMVATIVSFKFCVVRMSSEYMGMLLRSFVCKGKLVPVLN